jgi:hypothetical protein
MPAVTACVLQAAHAADCTVRMADANSLACLNDHWARDVPSPGLHVVCHAIHLLYLQKELQKAHSSGRRGGGSQKLARKWGVAADGRVLASRYERIRPKTWCRDVIGALPCIGLGLATGCHASSCCLVWLPLALPHRPSCAAVHCLPRVRRATEALRPFQCFTGPVCCCSPSGLHDGRGPLAAACRFWN